MRGKDPLVLETSALPRITPAYAGDHLAVLCCAVGAHDHPRVCGEKRQAVHLAAGNAGSPPRMRGKAHLSPSAQCRPGITPAYAGKSSTSPGVRRPSRDHPRVCGEKKTHAKPPHTYLGSPPRMRGKESEPADCDDKRRITPAYAGKRRTSRLWQKACWDHPRVCGEKDFRPALRFAGRGSPPRMRGKGHAGREVVVIFRITPAYAGKS